MLTCNQKKPKYFSILFLMMPPKSSISSFDKRCLQLALKLAQKGLFSTSPNPRVGCVIYQEGEKIAEGFHKEAGDAHAEIHALKEAGKRSKGSHVYVTLEPCAHHGRTPPCVQALIQKGVSRVIIGSLDPNPKTAGLGIKALQEAGIKVDILNQGSLHSKLLTLNQGFFKRMKTGLPWVRLKIAQSLDGNIALQNGESQWITGQESREHAHQIRAQSDAIITGSETILMDNPTLNARILGQPIEKKWQPLNIILDRRARITPHFKIFSSKTPVWLFSQKITPKRKKDFEPTTHAFLKENLPLLELLKYLGEEGMNEVLIESGSKLAHAFLSEDLVDEIMLYQSPLILGEGKPSFLGVLKKLPNRQFSYHSFKPLGEDILLQLLRAPYEHY